MNTISIWNVYEADLQSIVERENQLLDVQVEVDFYSPGGRKAIVDAFWDGELMWRVRFAPDEYGEWRWVSRCSDKNDVGLNGQTGYLICEKRGQVSDLLRRGPLKVSPRGQYLCANDGTAFFWLADTAWNGVLRAKDDEWGRYLAHRRKQGFTAIQFVCTHWRGCTADALGETGFTGFLSPVLNPGFFARLDNKIAAINEAGLVAVPVMLWACLDTDPGLMLGTQAAAVICRYLLARYGAYQVVWLLGGDGDYAGEKADKWIEIGGQVFVNRPRRLVGMHCGGKKWPSERLRQEPWLDFVGYQSGHGETEKDLRWLLDGPPSQNQKVQPAKPALNLEPNYEGHPAYGTTRPFTDFEVRRAAWWSLLLGCPLGVSYGNNNIWVWAHTIEKPLNHDNLPSVAPWDVGLDTDGITSMSVLRRFFDRIHWWEYSAWPQLIHAQPGGTNPSLHVACAGSADRETAIIYTPGNQVIYLTPALAATLKGAHWFDPRTGALTPARAEDTGASAYCPPDDNDWVLVLGEFPPGAHAQSSGE